jgi:predicted dehydrogenase
VGTLGAAVIGAGYWGPNLVRNFSASSEYELRWVCDLDEARATKVAGQYGSVRITPSLDDVLSDDRVDVVAIATPAATHTAVALAALQAGKHVLVEKPLASSYADAEKVVEEARRADLVVMCDHTYCYTPAVRKIRDLISAGELGDIHYVDSVRINLGLVQPDVDVIWDLAPHDLSIMDVILPAERRPIAVAAHGADPVGTGRACVAHLSLTLPADAIAHVHVNWLSPTKIRTFVVGGSRRTLVWDDLNPSQRITIYDRGVDLLSADPADARAAAMISYRSGDMIAPALPEGEALRSVVEELASAVRESRPPLTDGASGLRVLDILESASRSLEFKGAIVPLRAAR